MPGKRFAFLAIAILLSLSACSTPPVQPVPTQTAAPTPFKIPFTEAEVPRVTVEEARAALESGEAIIVDVRSAAAFADHHIAGAINLQLGEIETNPTGLDLDPDRWIITYCT